MKRLLWILWGCGLAVSARANLILSDGFDYADGSLTNVSAGAWVRTSGLADPSDLLVSANQLQVVSSRSDDANRSLGGAYSSGSLYYSLKVNLSSAPGGTSGAYLAALQNAAGSLFRDRIFVQTNGAASGSFRIGIANGSSASTFWASDLSLGTEYTVVVRSDLDSDTTHLWINPVNESSLSIQVTQASTVDVYAFGVRQSSGMGTSTIDDLRVGTTFADVAAAIPEPASMGLLAVGVEWLMLRRRRAGVSARAGG